MAFDWTYRDVHRDAVTRLTRDGLVAKACELGLSHAYAIDAIDVVHHRWRRDLVDVVVHVGYGDDLLDPQLPDDVHDVVTAAIAALARGA